MIYIRYVLARPAIPVPPNVLTKRNGKLRISTDKRQDTTAPLYMQACQELETDVDPTFLEFLKNRDENGWTYTLDIPVTEDEPAAIASEFPWITRRMRHIRSAPERNLWACGPNNCDWVDLCHADHTGNIDEWWGTSVSDYTGHRTYRLKAFDGRYPIGHYDKVISKSEPGKIVTPSELRCFLTCQRKWWFEYAKQKQLVVSYDRISARARGIFCHQAAEYHGKNWNEGHPSRYTFEDFRQWANDWMSHRNTEWHGPPEEWEEKLDLFWKTGEKLYLLATDDMDEVIAIEERLGFVLPGTKSWVSCQPDIICKKGDDIYVIDYKTSSKKRLDQAAESYRANPSMYLYALAVKRGFLLKETENV